MNILPVDDQITAFGPARSTIQKAVVGAEEIGHMNAYWRATLYLSLAMIYLRENPLVREPLLGHWGSDPGLSLIYVHLNRLIKKYDLNMIYVAGPGHGAPALISNAYLEGTYSEVYPEKSEDIDGMRRLFKSFSFPGGIGSHCTPELPGSLHEGGELGYSLSHAYGIDRSRLPGIQINFLIHAVTVPSCRSCISMDTRSITPRCSRVSVTGNWKT
jgi:xylulose-5-phosphate/fructose-6-phosphate phosphoketolase